GAHDRVGGRSFPQVVDAARFDVGGQWLGRGHTRLEKLAAELGVKTFPQYTKGARVMEVAGKVSTYKGTIPKLSPFKLIQLQLALSFLHKLEKKIDPVRPLDDPKLALLDAISVEELAGKWLLSSATRDLFAAASRVIFGAEMRDLSALYFLAYARASNGFEALVESENGTQAIRVVGGAQAISLGRAEEPGAGHGRDA